MARRPTRRRSKASTSRRSTARSSSRRRTTYGRSRSSSSRRSSPRELRIVIQQAPTDGSAITSPMVQAAKSARRVL